MVEDKEQGLTLSVNAALIFEKDEKGNGQQVPTLVIKTGGVTTKFRSLKIVQHFCREVEAACKEFEELQYG